MRDTENLGVATSRSGDPQPWSSLVHDVGSQSGTGNLEEAWRDAGP